MKSNRKIFMMFLIIVSSLILTGCRDQQSANDEFAVVFYTSLYGSSIETTIIDTIPNAAKGSYITKPENPTADGVVFVGWYKEIEYINEWDFDTDTVQKSTVIYAKWEMSNLTIEYIFDAAGGQLIDAPITAYTVTELIVLPKADRLGSLFLGWILTPVSEYKVGDPVLKSTEGYSENLSLYALFENKEYTIRFRSLMDGVSNPSTYVIEFASIMDFPILEDTATDSFVGWFSLDGTETAEWGFQYQNDELFLGKALSYDELTSTWEFIPQGVKLYARWESK